MNIMILSAGIRNMVIRAFKNELETEGRVIATDCSDLAPAVYEADEFIQVPRMDEPGYMDIILQKCIECKADAVISLIDPELSLLAENRDMFIRNGITPVISDHELVETCFDKYKMYEKLKSMGLHTGACFRSPEDFFSALDSGDITFPVFAKPVRGSASLNINKIYSREEAELLFGRYPDLMFQEFMDGQEYGADVYIDMISGKCVEIFVKKKIRMRSGETDKSVSVKDEELFGLLKDFTEKCGFRGVIDVDIFRIGESWYISEVNPRFGGGYPHAYACGVNFPVLIINNLKGIENPVNIGDYKEGVHMMKYVDAIFR